jgi:hypothetical protein
LNVEFEECRTALNANLSHGGFDMGSKMGNEMEGYFNDFMDDMESDFGKALESGLKSAFEGGNFGESVKNSFSSAMQGLISSSVSGLLLGGGGSSGSGGGGAGASGGIMNLLGGTTSGGGSSGGILSGLLGSGLSFFGGGLGGVVGGIGMIASAAGMFGKGSQRPGQSGVDSIFGDGPRVNDYDIGSLYGSDFYDRVAFSGRNSGNALLSGFAQARTNPEVTVNIKPSREFDAISEDKWVKSSTLNELAGIPRRTNFNHG